MILRFKTKNNRNGNRTYLAIDTEKKVFCRHSPKMIMEGVEVTITAIREIKNECLCECYKEVDYKEAF